MRDAMEVSFTQRDVRKLTELFGVSPKREGNCYRFEVENKEQGRRLILEIFPAMQIGKRRGHLISVYTPTAHLQLHFCTAFVVSEMLGEVTFVGESNGKVSGLTVEREGGCALYANVDRAMLSGDFTTLGPEVMLTGIALSLTEPDLPAPSKGGRGAGRKARRRPHVRQARK
jgi:hypothetical protein